MYSVALMSTPRGRLRRDEHARAARQLAGENQLLDVAAGEIFGRRGVRRRLDVVALNQVGVWRAMAPKSKNGPRANGRWP